MRRKRTVGGARNFALALTIAGLAALITYYAAIHFVADLARRVAAS